MSDNEALQVGDYVRWENRTGKLWAIGELESIGFGGSHAQVRISESCEVRFVGGDEIPETWIKPGTVAHLTLSDRCTLLRITRPNTPLVVGDYVRWTSPVYPDSWAEGTILRKLTGSVCMPVGFDIDIERVCPGRAPSDARVGAVSTVAIRALRRIERSDATHRTTPTDPLDAIIDGISLRNLMLAPQIAFTQAQRSALAAQRAAVSARWSAELRARIQASTPSSPSVTYSELDADDDQWR